MNQISCILVSFLVLVLTLSELVLSAPHLQFAVPRQQFGSSEDDSNSESVKDTIATISASKSAEKLRHALRSLLELDDEEINSLLKVGSRRTSSSSSNMLLKSSEEMAPSSALFLHASKNRLEQLKTLISRSENNNDPEENNSDSMSNKMDNTIVDDNPETFHPHGMLEAGTMEKDEEEQEFETSSDYLDEDSLLQALNILSKNLAHKKASLKRRNKRGKHKRHNSYHSSKHRTHYSYFLRSGECPKTSDGMQMAFCPSPDQSGEWVCVDEQDLCNGHSQCPGHEDEDPKACLFYKSIRNYLDMVAASLWRSRKSNRYSN